MQSDPHLVSVPSSVWYKKKIFVKEIGSLTMDFYCYVHFSKAPEFKTEFKTREMEVELFSVFNTYRNKTCLMVKCKKVHVKATLKL